MKIAITGASGFLGTQLVEVLADKGESLVLLGRSGVKLEETFGAIPDVQLVETDYSVDSLKQAFHSIDATVHLAAILHQKNHNSFADYIDNVQVSENLFCACEFRKVSNIVFASSRTMYSESVNRIPFSESEAVFPKILYAISKLTAEKLGCLYNIDLKCLRFAQLIGVNAREGFMLMTFLECAREGKPLVLFGEGQGRREYLYVKDAAAAIMAALGKPDQSGVFNVGSGVSTSHRELAEAICAVFGEDGAKLVSDKTKTEDMSQVLMDGTKFRQAFGWEPQYSLEATLADMKKTYEA